MSARILNGGEPKSKVTHKGLGAYFYNQAKKYEERICHIDADLDTNETFSSVQLRTVKAAVEMRKRGVTPDHVILIVASNTIISTIPFIAASYLGAKVSAIDPYLTVRDATHAISLLKPFYIFAQEDALEVIEKSLSLSYVQGNIVVLGDNYQGTYANFKEFQRDCSEVLEFKPVEIEDVHQTALVMFSSGTSGLPKGICLSHYSLLFNSMDLNPQPFGAICFSSFFWLSGVSTLIISFAIGVYRVVTPRFHPEKVLSYIEKYNIQFMFTSPTLANQLINVPNSDSYNCSNLKFVVFAGACTSDKQLEKARQLFKQAFVIVAYGATELGGGVTTFDWQRDAKIYKNKIGSSGKVMAGVQLKIVDPETREILGPNLLGEVCAKSASRMNGYYNQDSSAAFDEDGFYKTGDLAFYDEDEFLYVQDRIKEIFKYQSYQIVPSTLENILLEHPAVKEAVVFDIPNEADGSHPAACVSLKPGMNVAAEELEQFIAGKVSEVQKLRGGVRIVEEIEKTPSGKPLRRVMKEYFLKGTKKLH